ncbi:MAG: GNAT family N-acetyltransferase [Actinomycetota bacterium]|nr:GNAT family N-acetyltransferase [Actinomycetota bacterium]
MPSGSEPGRPGALRLSPPALGDEGHARTAHAELAPEGFDFLHHPELAWPEQVRRYALDARGVDLDPGRVRATYLLAWVGDELVGRVSVRHELNAFLLQVGGHVGYAVLPAHRRCGYAMAMLRQAVDMLREEGLDRVLVTCDDDNPSSAAVIERCGGMLEDKRAQGAGRSPKRRYWITL